MLIAPGQVRYAVGGRIHGRPWVNILDMDIDPAVLDNRNDAINDQARVILNCYSDFISPRVTVDWWVDRVRWVDLTSASGGVGERSTTPQHTFPQQGSRTGEGIPPNVAVLVRKAGGGNRSSRSGRMFIPGASESDAEGRGLSGTAMTAWQSAMSAFLSGLNQTGGGTFDYESHLTVLHTVGGVYEGNSQVSALTVDSVFATQRRRLRG